MTNSNNLHLEGMDFHGCTVQLNNCNSSTVKNVDLLYPTFNREILEKGPVDEAEQRGDQEEHYTDLGDQERADDEGRTVARLQYWLGARDVSSMTTIKTEVMVSRVLLVELFHSIFRLLMLIAWTGHVCCPSQLIEILYLKFSLSNHNTALISAPHVMC